MALRLCEDGIRDFGRDGFKSVLFECHIQYHGGFRFSIAFLLKSIDYLFKASLFIWFRRLFASVQGPPGKIFGGEANASTIVVPGLTLRHGKRFRTKKRRRTNAAQFESERICGGETGGCRIPPSGCHPSLSSLTSSGAMTMSVRGSLLNEWILSRRRCAVMEPSCWCLMSTNGGSFSK